MSKSKTKYPITDHYDGSRFHNEDRSLVETGLTDVLRWQLNKETTPWPEQVNDNVQPRLSEALTDQCCALTFLNHASELIQLNGLTVITDPLFSERTSPFSWAGPKRHRAPGIALPNLPKIDVVLISHNHYDHLDIESLVQLEKLHSPLFVVPLGNQDLLSQRGIQNVVELDWWQNTSFHDHTFTLVPMQHWSSRSPFDRFKTLWGGFVIESRSLKILFAGDTGYGAQFKAIEKRFGPMDVCLLPIGAYEPRWFMKNHHMNPEDSVKAHIDLKSTWSQAIHFGTFQLTDEGMEDPVTDLAKARTAMKLGDSEFVAVKNGHTNLFQKSQS